MTEDIAIAWADDVWTIDGDEIRMLGIPFRTRMVIVRLSSGGLWLWSPVAATPSRVAAVEALGPVAHVVAPNKLHHVHVGPWLERYPDATSWAGPGLAKRREDLSFDGEIADEAPEAWAADLDQVIFRGSFVLDEPIFLHRASGTLIVVDVLQNHDPARDGAFFCGVKKLNHILAPNGGFPLDLRLTVRDRAAARASVDRLMTWDFDRLILAHGICLERDARQYVERAFAWLR